MADSIRIKRGVKADLPKALPLGELAYCTDTRQLFIGTGNSIAPVKAEEIHFDDLNERLEGNSQNINKLYKDVDELGSRVSNHNHDDRYYTEEEINSKINTINNNIGQLSNPNFLINGGFRVNQRGKSEYTDSGKYSMDRWQFNTSSGGSLAVKDDYISLTNKNEQNTYLRYYFEDDDAKFLDGKTVTVSVLYRSTETFRVKLGRLDGILLPPTQDWTLKTHTINLSSWRDTNRHDDSSLILQAYNNSKYTNGTLDVKWIKLELGDKPTPFVPRPYGEELALCQRYYQRLNTKRAPFATFGIALGMGSTSNRLLLSLPVQMRTVPTVSIVGNVRVKDGNIFSKAKSVSVDQWGGINGKLILNTEQSIPNGFYECSGDNDINADLILDAEIY